MNKIKKTVETMIGIHRKFRHYNEYFNEITSNLSPQKMEHS